MELAEEKWSFVFLAVSLCTISLSLWWQGKLLPMYKHFGYVQYSKGQNGPLAGPIHVRGRCTYVDGEQYRTVHRPNQGAFDGGSGGGTSVGS